MFLLPALGTPCIPAIAASTDYDGKWRVHGNCSANTGWPWSPAFQFDLDMVLENGQFSGIRNSVDKGVTRERKYSGDLQGQVLAISMDGKGSNGWTWKQSFSGHAVSSKEIVFDGTETAWSPTNWVATRTCAGTLRLVEPGVTSLAGKERQQHGQPSNPAPAPTPVTTASARPSSVPTPSLAPNATPSPVPAALPVPVPASLPVPVPAALPRASPVPTPSPIPAASPVPGSPGISTAASLACQKFPNLCP